VSDRAAALLSNNFIYSAMVIYSLALVSHAVEVAWSVKTPETAIKKTKLDFSRTARIGRLGSAFMILATILLSAGVVLRGISANRVPWGNMYEFSISGALTFSIAYLYALKKYKMRWLGLPAALAILLTLGTAVTLLYRPSAPLVPALKSTWLVIHVSAAIISGGVFLLANFIAGTYLILDYFERNKGRPVWIIKFPTLEDLDNFSYRLIAFVFPLWTFSVIAGAIWAEAAWGRYWGWDPKETWAFITWVAYAAYLHARVTVGWRGRKAAWLCLLAGSTFLFNYIYINIWGTGKHTYSGL
jgi:cytochrome c-type biogenesis protein CcsB